MHIMNEEPLKNLAKKNPSEPNQINTACINRLLFNFLPFPLWRTRDTALFVDFESTHCAWVDPLAALKRTWTDATKMTSVWPLQQTKSMLMIFVKNHLTSTVFFQTNQVLLSFHLLFCAFDFLSDLVKWLPCPAVLGNCSSAPHRESPNLLNRWSD